MVSKEEMEPSSWCIYHTKSSQKQIRGEKLGASEVGGKSFYRKYSIEQLIAYFWTPKKILKYYSWI
jgi:hypothetical protein